MENLRLDYKGNVLSVIFDQEITMDVTPDLKKEIEAALAAPHAAVVMDLSQVPFMDSAGIGFLASLNARIQNSGKRLYLFKPSRQVRKTLELVQLIAYFDVVESEADLAARLSA